MRDRDALLISALAVTPVTLAFSVLVGAGMMRQAPPLLVSIGAGVLLVLPALGMTTPFHERLSWLPLGMLVWSMMVLVGFPMYFPGERAPALAAGITVVSEPAGLSVSPEWMVLLDEALPGLSVGRALPPTAAATPEALPRPLPRLLPGGALPAGEQPDEVVLPYEGSGQSLSIPIGFVGADGEDLDTWMLFDTGASLTTLDPKTLAALGVDIPDDAPTLKFATAGGERVAPVVLVDEVWIGGLLVEGVTVGVCEECAFGHSVGLLGNNVSSRFLVTVDQQRKELTLRPREDQPGREMDIRPWLEISVEATRWSDGRTELSADVENRADRDVTDVVLSVMCADTYPVEIPEVPRLGSVTAEASLPLGADCSRYRVKLDSARW